MIRSPAASLTALLMAGAVAPAVAAAPGRQGAVAEGRHIAEAWCRSCHLIGNDGGSGASNGAPSFIAIARGAGASADFLYGFLQTGHGGMPDLHLTRAEIAALSAYIDSLSQDGAAQGR